MRRRLWSSLAVMLAGACLSVFVGLRELAAGDLADRTGSSGEIGALTLVLLAVGVTLTLVGLLRSLLVADVLLNPGP